MRRLTGWLTFLMLLGAVVPAPLAAADRVGEIRVIYGTRGFKGKVRWGDAGMRLDFAYPRPGGEVGQASLIVLTNGGASSLLLHDTQEVVEGRWALSSPPSPLDLLAPSLGDTPLTPIGEVFLDQLKCGVLEAHDVGPADGELRVWLPTAFPDIPRLVRYMEGDTSAELSLGKVRPTTLAAGDLVVPPTFQPVRFDMEDLLTRATDSDEAADLGARALVWMATTNLERQLQAVEYAILVEAD